MINDDLKTARIDAIIDYLLLTKNIDEAIDMYKDLIVTPDFILEFTLLLNALEYPEFSKDNAKKIVKNMDDKLCEEAKKEFYELIEERPSSYDIYESEFILKNNTIDFENKDYFVWTQEDFEKSLEYDILFLNSLMATKENFETKYLDYLILNPYFLYSVNKFAYIKPFLLNNEHILNRILTIISINTKIIDANRATIRGTNCDYEELERQNNLDTMATNTVVFLHNLADAKFSFDKLKNYIEHIGIENYIYYDNKMNTDWISIDSVYKYIDIIRNIEKSAKTKLIDLLDSKKENFKGEELIIYNTHLRKLNSLEESIIDHDTLNMYKKMNRNTLLKYNAFKKDKYSRVMSDIKKSNENDLKVFKFLVSNENDFCQTLDEEFEPYYVYSIIKFIKDMPSLFTNYQLNVRAHYVLEHYMNEHSLEAGKVLEKMIGK